MDFSLNDTQQEIRDLAARIIRDFCTQERLRELDDSGYFDPGLWTQLAESGLLGLAIDETYGGMGLDFETLCVLLEESGRYVAPVPLLPVLVTAALPLQRFAKKDIAGPILSSLAKGQSLVTAALVERRPAASPLESTASAVRRGDAWRIHGVKHCVPFAARAAYCWLVAMIHEEAAVFLLDLGADGVRIESQTTTTGEFEATLTMREAPARLIASGDTARAFVDYALDISMTANAVLALGVCAEMTRLGASYTTEREQFGKPIATFQAVAHHLANCHIDTECLRLAAIQAMCALRDQADARDAVLTARFWTGEALHRVSHTVQQVHGGTGVDRDYPLFRYCLWAKKLELAFGGSNAALAALGRRIAA